MNWNNNNAHSLNSWQPPKDVHLHIHNAHGKNDNTGAYNTVDASTQYWNTPTTWNNPQKRASFGRELFYNDKQRQTSNHTRTGNEYPRFSVAETRNIAAATQRNW